MAKRTRSTKAAADEAIATLRARLQQADATEVLEELDRSPADPVVAVSALFLHTLLGRGIEDDVAEALARIGEGIAMDSLVIGLGSKRVAVRRAAARALCIAPSRSRDVHAALRVAAAARDEVVRTLGSVALALASKRPAVVLAEALERATTYEARCSIVRVFASSADAELREALLSRTTDPNWADVRDELLDVIGTHVA